VWYQTPTWSDRVPSKFHKALARIEGSEFPILGTRRQARASIPGARMDQQQKGMAERMSAATLSRAVGFRRKMCLIHGDY
jgi:hypothetical protein